MSVKQLIQSLRPYALNLSIIIITIFIMIDVPLAQSRRVWVPTEQDDLVYLYGDRMAMIVGESNYEHLPRLHYAVRDAEDVAEALRELGFTVETMIDPASKELRKKLRGLPHTDMGRTSDSALLIYFAGHGFTEVLADTTKLGYILPRDAPPLERDRQGFSETAISMNEFVELAMRLKNRHVLMVFDSCFSGSLFNIMRANPGVVRDSVAYPVRQFITSGGENDEVPDKSIFKKIFIEGIKGDADSDRDGFVTGTELGAYLQDKVGMYSNHSQNPQFGKIKNPCLDKGNFVFMTQKATKNIQEQPKPGSGIIRPKSHKWYVYKDADSKENHGEWTNWLPENSGDMLNLSLVSNKSRAYGSTAVRVDVRFQHPWWCGIAISSQENYWGEEPSDFAYDLSRARKLVFHARGEEGGEMIRVKVAIAGDKPHGDSSVRPADTRWLRLSREWRRYELPLDGYDLKRVITPFAFVTDRVHNEAEAIRFYLDEIYFTIE